MVYQRRVVKIRPASLTDEEWLTLTERGRQARESFMLRDGRDVRGPADWVILCHWCRGRHPASEVAKCMVLPRKVVDAPNSASCTLSASDAGPLRPFVELWGFLTQEVYEDGAKRQAGKLSLSCESGVLGLSLSDVDNGQYAYLEGASLQEVLKDAEKRLVEGRVPWRASKWPPKVKAKK
jgi:hypothetical protein